MLLSPELRSRLERLSLVARRRIRSQWAGRHGSTALGQSLDFADHREYVPGDDFRRIDHDLWARLGILLIRRYEAEEELGIRVVLDVSKSMDFGEKATTARLLAGMVAYLGLAGGDRVTVLAAPGRERPIERGPSGRHLSAWPGIERWIEDVQVGGALDLASVLRTVAAAEPGRGVTVLISDLFDVRWMSALDGLITGAGGLVLHVLAASEIEPELAGDLVLVDSERNVDVEVSTSAETLAAYRESLERFTGGAAARARRAGLDYLLVPAGEGAADQVLRALVEAGAAR